MGGHKHLCRLKLVSILSATLWKVVMKCKTDMYFNFLGSFSQNVHFWGWKILSHVTLISWIFLKFSPVVGFTEIWKPWKYQPLTPSISEFVVFFKNGKLACFGWHFKYYFVFDSFCFKPPLVLKIHRGMFFDSRHSKMTSKLP